MTSPGTLFLYAAAVVLSGYALRRHDASLPQGLQRAFEQLLKLAPRMICALVMAGFMVKLIPANVVGGLLGADAGFTAILVGSLAGLVVPSGPPIAFAIAATFANENASVPALVSFITGWSVFAMHRVLIFELPLLGPAFVRLRMASVVILPLLAGTIAMFAETLMEMMRAAL
jgi:uncharacterized protein